MTTATTLPAVTWSSGDAGAPLPPLVPGLPVLGNALSLQNDPLTFLVDCYHQYGPIFRLKALNRAFTVMAGSEANQFLARAGDEHFSSELLFGGFAEEMGTRIFMVAMDGEPHRRLRKLMRRGFSREAIGDHMDKVVALARAETARWSPGKLIPLLRRLQILVAAQLGVVTVGREPGEDFDDIARFLNTNMRATVLRTAPRLMLQTPWYKRSKARVAEVADAVLAWHQAHPPVDRPADLVDDMLAARTDAGEPYDRATLRVWAVGPFFAGIDTVANTLTFMVYVLVKHPEVLARVRAEAAALLAGPLDDARSLKEYPALYGLVLETLRRYPVAAFTPRMAVQPFTFAGHRVEVGTEVMVANGVAHMLPQHFPNPEVFDIDRYQPPRNEHRQPNVFAPYTLGAHTCLGAGMAEVEMLLTIATIAHTVDLELPPTHANPGIALAPLPSLGPGFRVRVKAGAR